MAETGRAEAATGSEQDATPEASAAAAAAVAGPSSSESPPAAPPASHKIQLEVRLLQALEIYHPSKLQGIHKHFVLYGIMEYLEKRLGRHISSQEILEVLSSFYNLGMLQKPEDDESELSRQTEDFSLPPSLRGEST